MSRTDYARHLFGVFALLCFAGLAAVYPLWMIGATTAAVIGDAFFGAVLFVAAIFYVVQLCRGDVVDDTWKADDVADHKVTASSTADGLYVKDA